MSEMDASGSGQEEGDKETTDLQGLLDVFASVCSLEEIALAYCSAKGNVDDAGDILVELQNTRNGNCAYEGGALFVEDKKSLFVHKKSRGLKQNKFTVSTGIVSNAVGRGYALSHQSRVRSLTAEKLSKPEQKKMHPSEMLKSDLPAKSKLLNSQDVEDFLFLMLHDGFNLDKQMTQDVLRSCGYDLTKSMEELLLLSSKDVKGKEMMHHMDNSTGASSGENRCSEEHHLELNGSHREVNGSSLGEQSDVHMAVLEALYGNTNIPQEEPKRPRLELGLNRKRVPREKVVSVTAPSFDTKVKPIDIKASIVMNDDGRYDVLREAAKTHWDMMKMYYESALNAFTSGDRKKANYLMERGKHHNKLAREADEKSVREITTMRNMDMKDIFPLDLHMHHPKEAVTLLKQHLRSLAGISSISHLKVILDSDTEDVTKRRRKQEVMKFLEKQSIGWNMEEGKPGIMVIRMDLIDPQKLTFT